MTQQGSPQALTSVAGRVVIVTGGGRGIGRIYSERLAEAGACIVVADIAADAAEAAAKNICKSGGRAIAVPTDVASEKAVQNMAEVTAKEFGRIDALINNAALMSTLPRRPWSDIPVEEWDLVMGVNLRGIFLCCRAVFPYMKAQRKGKIINISSGRVWEGTPNRLHYTTSKAGVIGFTRSLAREVGEYNIAVNAITPGLTMSDTQAATTGANYSSVYDQGRAFQRAQVPDDLVGTVLFLVSDASNFITGQTINVDGGKAMH